MDEHDKEKDKAPEKNNISSVIDRLVSAIVKPPPPPRVSLKTVEDVGMRMVSFGYQMSEWSVKVLVDYLKGYNLCLRGKPGVGKTFFFECMSKFRISQDKSPIVKLSMVETQGWTMEMTRDWVDETRDYDVLIDDVGTEPIEMVSYGQRVDLFPYLLEKRMQLTGNRTHMTSNLGDNDIFKRYGWRIWDRLRQMFKIHDFPNEIGGVETKSRRSAKPWKRVRDGAGAV